MRFSRVTNRLWLRRSKIEYEDDSRGMDPSFLAIVPKIVLVLELVLDSYWLIFALMGRPASRIAAQGRSLALGIAF